MEDLIYEARDAIPASKQTFGSLRDAIEDQYKGINASPLVIRGATYQPFFNGRWGRLFRSISDETPSFIASFRGTRPTSHDDIGFLAGINNSSVESRLKNDATNPHIKEIDQMTQIVKSELGDRLGESLIISTGHSVGGYKARLFRDRLLENLPPKQQNPVVYVGFNSEIPRHSTFRYPRAEKDYEIRSEREVFTAPSKEEKGVVVLSPSKTRPPSTFSNILSANPATAVAGGVAETIREGVRAHSLDQMREFVIPYRQQFDTPTSARLIGAIKSGAASIWSLPENLAYYQKTRMPGFGSRIINFFRGLGSKIRGAFSSFGGKIRSFITPREATSAIEFEVAPEFYATARPSLEETPIGVRRATYRTGILPSVRPVSELLQRRTLQRIPVYAPEGVRIYEPVRTGAVSAEPRTDPVTRPVRRSGRQINRPGRYRD